MKIIINNQADIDNIKALEAVKLHMINIDSMFCDFKVGTKHYTIVRKENKLSVRYSLYNI